MCSLGAMDFILGYSTINFIIMAKIDEKSLYTDSVLSFLTHTVLFFLIINIFLRHFQFHFTVEAIEDQRVGCLPNILYPLKSCSTSKPCP